MNYIHIKYFLNIISKNLILACFLVPFLLKATDDSSVPRNVLADFNASMIITDFNEKMRSDNDGSHLWTLEQTLQNIIYFRSKSPLILKYYFELLIDQRPTSHSSYNPSDIRADFDLLMKTALKMRLSENQIAAFLKFSNLRMTKEELLFSHNTPWFAENISYITTVAGLLNYSDYGVVEEFSLLYFFTKYFPKLPPFSNIPIRFLFLNSSGMTEYLSALNAHLSSETSEPYFRELFNFMWAKSISLSNCKRCVSPFEKLHDLDFKPLTSTFKLEQ
jgi:hypothetical protein